MAEETYPQFKQVQTGISTTAEPKQPGSGPSKEVRPRSTLRRRPYRALDYATFKVAVAELKQEIREQHTQTRAEVQSARRDILSAVKASPSEYVKLVCQFAFVFLLFSLAVRFVLKIELVNPAFASFMLPALAVYWAMAHLKQKSGSREDKIQQA